MVACDEELEKKAWVDREMSARNNCDVYIKKRDGIIVYSVVREIMPEIRARFNILFNEEKDI